MTRSPRGSTERSGFVLLHRPVAGYHGVMGPFALRQLRGIAFAAVILTAGPGFAGPLQDATVRGVKRQAEAPRVLLACLFTAEKGAASARSAAEAAGRASADDDPAPASARGRSGEVRQASHSREAESVKPQPLSPGDSESQSSPRPEASAPAPKPPAGAAETGAGVKMIELPGRDGRPVLVPLDATVEGYLEWLESRKAREYAINWIELTGTSDEDGASITAVVKVQILRDEGWVRVPLYLNEAILQDAATYKGSGQAVLDADRRTPDSGYRWFFKGRGEHELTLSLKVPLTKLTPGRRLTLTLPPDAAGGSLSLRVPVPHGRLKAEPPKGSSTSTKPLARSVSEIKVVGLGPRLDLQWQALPVQRPVETILRAETSIMVELIETMGKAVELTALQTVRAVPGSFSQLRVQLPPGFELISLSSNEMKDYTVDAKNQATVRLLETSSGPVTLKWVLQSGMPPEGGPLALDGFQVDGARAESGEIAFVKAQGFRIQYRDGDEDRYVRRIGADEFAARELVRNVDVAAAYRFRGQPFHLVRVFREIEPYVVAAPQFTLRFSERRAELEAAFVLDVDDRAAIREFAVNWPGWKEEGWTISELHADSILEPSLVSKLSQLDESELIRVRLDEPKTGTLKLTLKAERDIAAGESGNDLSLPTVEAAYRRPAALVVETPENIEARLAARGETELEELPVPTAQPGRLHYRIDSDAQALSARIAVHTRQVTTHTVAVANVAASRLTVRQQIHYDVRYEKLSEVRLIVPRDFAGKIQFFSPDGEALRTTRETLPGESEELVRLALPRPQKDSLEFVAEFTLDLSGELEPGGETTALLPLVRTAEADYVSVRFEFESQDGVEAAISDESWRRELTTDDSIVWQSSAAKPEIPLSLRYSTSRPSQRYSIRKALLRTAIDQDGYARSRGQYLISGPVSTIVLILPPDVVPEEFWWNQKKLNPEQIHRLERRRDEYRIEVVADPDSDGGLFTIDFRSQRAEPVDWAADHTIEAPQFPPNVWAEQTVWQIVTPSNQHLFTNPAGFTPLFEWTRGGVFWSRVPRSEDRNPDRWISAGPPQRSEFASGNSYQFRRFGPAEALRFHSMSRSMILLIGAGLALAAGFVLLKIPVLRSVLTLLAAAFAVALVGLWHAAPVQVLLQPALLGLLLAITAFLIEWSVKRRRRSPILTLSTHSDFVLSGGASPSSIERRPMPGAGSQDATALRPVSAIVPRSISASSDGSHAM